MQARASCFLQYFGSSHDIPIILLYYNLDSVLSDVFGVGTHGASAFHNAVLDVGVVADVHIIEDDGILDHAVVADVSFPEDHGILYRAVDDTTAGHQGIDHTGTAVVLCGRQIRNF